MLGAALRIHQEAEGFCQRAMQINVGVAGQYVVRRNAVGQRFDACHIRNLCGVSVIGNWAEINLGADDAIVQWLRLSGCQSARGRLQAAS